jgi:hypothetical protein
MKKLLPVISLFVAAYILSYFLLSRYSRSFARKDGIEGFFYVPTMLSNLGASTTLQHIHEVGINFYYPIWSIDHAFGGPPYCHTPMFEIGRPEDAVQE